MRVSEAIAEFLFRKHLDKAYQNGIREGAAFCMYTYEMKFHLRRASQELTKTQEIGYDKALKVARLAKDEVRAKTGAWR